jgi:hypothetical protein
VLCGAQVIWAKHAALKELLETAEEEARSSHGSHRTRALTYACPHFIGGLFVAMRSNGRTCNVCSRSFLTAM